jgi:hypothetical protein
LNKKLPLTHNIKQLGFSGLQAFGSCFSVFVGGQGRAPKTQPFHIVKRWGQLMSRSKKKSFAQMIFR